MPTLLIYGLVAAAIWGAGFGSAWYWQDLRWDAAQAEALEAQRKVADEKHRIEVDGINKRMEAKQRELEGIQKSLDTNLKLLAAARRKAEVLSDEYARLKERSQEVRDWARAPVPGDVCRLLDGLDCTGGGDRDRGREVPAPGKPPAGPAPARV